MRVSAKDLVSAIERHSVRSMDEFLARGGDPNRNLAEANTFLELDSVTGTYRLAHGNTLPWSVSIARPSEDDDDLQITPLHVAVVSAFRSYQSDGRDWVDANAIIDSLVRAEADLSIESKAVLVDQMGETVTNNGERHSPLALALALQEWVGKGSPQAIRYETLIGKLGGTLTEEDKTVDTIDVPRAVMATFEKLLLSDEGSDIKFVCEEDGEVLPAHRIILSAASPYFATAFEGPWAENNADGVWETSHPSYILKAALTVIYTGQVDTSFFQEHAVQILVVANEYELTPLKELATAHCIRSIDVEDFKVMLQLAHLHAIDDLKRACIDYARKNSVQVLTSPEVMTLSSEDANLWAEFTAALRGDGATTES